ncbi:hypothetical protein NKH77_44685 [Streptomyces sp. M19]
MGATLSEKHPESMYDLVCMWMETHYLPFSELLHSVRTGRPGAEKYLQEPFLTWMNAEPARAELFSRAMAEVTSGWRMGMFDGYRLPEGRTVADIGGADGSVLVQLLTRDDDPQRRGIVFDQSNVTPTAEKTLERPGSPIGSRWSPVTSSPPYRPPTSTYSATSCTTGATRSPGGSSKRSRGPRRRGPAPRRRGRRTAGRRAAPDQVDRPDDARDAHGEGARRAGVPRTPRQRRVHPRPRRDHPSPFSILEATLR